ncbi:transposable element Tcb1 transposase [Trichonephila clavipes]|nr:transposable element Tcb1 transposase [Trichonephila clavipes]
MPPSAISNNKGMKLKPLMTGLDRDSFRRSHLRLARCSSGESNKHPCQEDDDSVCRASIMADIDILEFVQSSKNIIDTIDSDSENEMKNAAPVSSSSEMKNIMKTFDQVSEFGRGRIVAYQDCGLSFKEIGSRVGRNQTTVIRICDHWMQKGTTDQRGQSHPSQCTTSRVDRQIVRMAVTDRSVASRIVAQHIESVTHHSVSERTIRRRLQQSGLSARRPLLGLSLTLEPQTSPLPWCNERRMWVAE